MNKLIVANWKMNPVAEKEAVVLAKAFDQEGIVICPPFPFLKSVAEIIKKAEIGAQDIFWEEAGAFTGEVSPKMLKELGVRYAIIGHSERRRYLGETDEMIAKKLEAVIRSGIIPILCVGEPARKSQIANRKSQISLAKEYVGGQLEKDLKNLTYNLKLATYNLIVAYEPVWAIGTGEADTPKDALGMIKYIKDILNSKFQILNSKVVYGGSVDSKNIGDFLKYDEIDGALVGGASLDQKEFKKLFNNINRKISRHC